MSSCDNTTAYTNSFFSPYFTINQSSQLFASVAEKCLDRDNMGENIAWFATNVICVVVRWPAIISGICLPF